MGEWGPPDNESHLNVISITLCAGRRSKFHNGNFTILLDQGRFLSTGKREGRQQSSKIFDVFEREKNERNLHGSVFEVERER
jgi:hypothetical protein